MSAVLIGHVAFSLFLFPGALQDPHGAPDVIFNQPHGPLLAGVIMVQTVEEFSRVSVT